MTAHRVNLTITLDTKAHPADALEIALNAMSRAFGSGIKIKAATACAHTDDDTIVTIVGAGQHTDGAYRSPEIDHDNSDTDNPALHIWLDTADEHQDEHYQYRLPVAVWPATEEDLP